LLIRARHLGYRNSEIGAVLSRGVADTGGSGSPQVGFYSTQLVTKLMRDADNAAEVAIERLIRGDQL